MKKIRIIFISIYLLQFSQTRIARKLHLENTKKSASISLISDKKKLSVLHWASGEETNKYACVCKTVYATSNCSRTSKGFNF